MLISIGVPTYNRSGLLGRAIASVLRQTHSEFELLVSDDCSPDDTEQVVRAFGDPRIRYLNTGVRSGVPKNWNECVRHATGEYFSLLPDDDEYAPEFLERMSACLSAEPSVAFVQCGLTAIDESSRSIGTRIASPTPRTLKGEEALEWQFSTLTCNPVAILFRRASMLAVGLWREDYWDDWAFIMKLAFRYGFRFLPEPMAHNRTHAANLSKQLAFAKRDGILDLINQTSDVFGASLPATPKLIALRAAQNRRIGRMGIRAAVKAFCRGEFAAAGAQIRRAHHLNSLALVDPMQIIELADAVRSMIGAGPGRAATSGGI
jgi:glycosyltransferase involved in cell wall biosynthesis